MVLFVTAYTLQLALICHTSTFCAQPAVKIAAKGALFVSDKSHKGKRIFTASPYAKIDPAYFNALPLDACLFRKSIAVGILGIARVPVQHFDAVRSAHIALFIIITCIYLAFNAGIRPFGFG